MTLRLVLLVPFREDATRTRAAQLRQLIERFVAVFDDPSRPALVVVCEQSDDGCRFNRGQCLNAAYAIATSTFSERIDRCGTHFACHDVDMAPEAATKTAYFVEDDARDGAGFVRVLQASGCRYDAEKCFGGVTIYDVTAFERTNGYPNGFYGWGGEDHAAFLRAEEACVRVERHSGAAFDDLEKDVETVAKKLKLLDAHDARINAKEKERLLKRNAKFWREEGLNSCAFDVIEKSVLRESPALTCVQFKVELKCARPGYIKCFTCATWLPEPEYSRKAIAAVRWSEKTGTKHERSCTSCTANLPKQIETEAQKAFNQSNFEQRLTCAECATLFASRTSLFKHLKSSPCGNQ